MATKRKEKDALGWVELPADCYWGAQTQRAIDNFQIGHQRFPATFIHIFAHHKAACAETNMALGLLPPKLAKAIIKACEDIIKGLWDSQFPLVVWQTGSGTQTNMNMNEVIANLANTQLGSPLGTKFPVHPNDHVNMGQSTNDNFPTVMHVSVSLALQKQLLPILKSLEKTLRQKAKAFSKIVAIGRTHLQDATPIRFSQHFETFANHIKTSHQHLFKLIPELCLLPQGGTAVGNGLNTSPKFTSLFCKFLSQRLHQKFKPLPNKSDAIAHHDVLQRVSSELTILASSLFKITNDLRLLASGPRCGLGEIILPANEPGSSIMPGKVNPTQIEALSMVCAQVMGYGQAINIAMTHGHLQLNVFKPLIINNILDSITLLTEGIASFIKHCLGGIKPNKAKIQAHLENSLMLVTALSPHIGYDKAAEIALHAHKNNLTLEEAAIKLGFLKKEEFQKWVDLKKMI